jgi:hypothetical protein
MVVDGTGKVMMWNYKSNKLWFWVFYLNLLEPSGLVKACNGVALPLHLVLK